MLSGVHRGWWHRACSFIFSFRIPLLAMAQRTIRYCEKKEKKPVCPAGNTLVLSITKFEEERKEEREESRRSSGAGERGRRRLVTYDGQPSNVDTVKSVSIAFATSSKWKRCWIQLLSFITGLLISPLSYSRYVPLKLSTRPPMLFVVAVSLDRSDLRESSMSPLLGMINRGQKENLRFTSMYVATTLNDIPRLGLAFVCEITYWHSSFVIFDASEQ